MPSPTVELVAQSPSGVEVAATLGIPRVELCCALELGGLSPSEALLRRSVSAGRAGPAPVEVHPLIRARPGDFVFDEAELDLMVDDVAHAVAAGAAGVVVGALDARGMPDLPFVERVLEAAAGAEVTFHRALDASADPVRAYEQLAGVGLTRVLTSGGRPTALEGRETLRALVALGLSTQVMAGSGVTAANVRAIADTGVDAVHLSAKRRVGGGGLAMGGSDDGGHDVTDAAAARALLDALSG
ncbi:Copper homeostasis protein cutC [Nostocoides japonicum T1-X7]|uniref:PF03932 family protein CutC n=1 Tax=Nostocoides japonicum T1-X7 TaxID=1194083 RepID=A0A077LW30_9MICO|nr:copper homeostasis protein CutC [Tetrasphaera japonica]CCH76174.1 Copper homeostasis protein cutC [Tetrasphaera japonica T1-X7]